MEQNDRLRLALQELRKQQISYFLKKSELKTQFLLQRKDEEIAKAVNKAMELENLVRRMETENQTWQRVAKEKEAMVMSLKNTIEHSASLTQLKTMINYFRFNPSAPMKNKNCSPVKLTLTSFT